MFRTLFALTAAACIAFWASPAQAKVDFEKQIVPIFQETCFKCHGPEKDKGKLRLDTRALFEKGSEEGAIFMAGNPDKSSLYKRISLPADHEDIMPPKGDPLTKEQQELIKQWIAEGADFGKWVETHVEGGHGSPTQIILPQVPAATPAALAGLSEAGALAMPLAANTHMLNVDFRSGAPNITDKQLAFLKPVAQQVAWLGLAGTQITDAGLEQITGLSNLRRLHLENTGITDAGLVHIGKLTELQYLNLYGTKVTDAGLKNLSKLAKLERLYLWQTQTTDAGVAALKKALPNLLIDTGYKAPVEEKPAAAAADVKLINVKCPVSGKPAVKEQFVVFKDQAVGFCCDKCKGKFEADSKPFLDKVENLKK